MYTLIWESSFLLYSAMQNHFGNWGNESCAASFSAGPLIIYLDGNNVGVGEKWEGEALVGDGNWGASAVPQVIRTSFLPQAVGQSLHPWTQTCPNGTEPMFSGGPDSSSSPPPALGALAENYMTGPVLLTMSKGELWDDLGVPLLAARWYLWDATKRLRNWHAVVDFPANVDLHKEEIVDDGRGPDGAAAAVLRAEIEKRRRIIRDSGVAGVLLADRGVVQSVNKDIEVPITLQTEFDTQSAQEEVDWSYTLSFDPNTGYI